VPIRRHPIPMVLRLLQICLAFVLMAGSLSESAGLRILGTLAQTAFVVILKVLSMKLAKCY
jgi:hypothetical protein